MELDDYAALLQKLESHSLRVNARRCVVTRNRNARCRACAEACTMGCITVKGNELAIDPEHCVGCGTCATACPTGAIEPRNPTDREIAHAAAQAMRKAEGTVVFACSDVVQAAGRSLDPDKVVAVACVGRLDESMLCVLAAAGACDIRLVAGTCAQCAHASGARMAHDVVESANTLLEVWSNPCRVRLADTFPAKCRNGDRHVTYDAQRREFLLSMKDGAGSAVRDVMELSIDKFYDGDKPHPLFEHVEHDGTLPHALPRRRQLLLDALDAMGEPADEMMETRLWGHVEIDAAACKECRMCAVFCPTGALSKRMVRGNDTGLVHAPGICVKCRTCEDVCRQNALQVHDAVFAIDMHAGVVESKKMGDSKDAKGGSDSIRNSMARFISGVAPV